MKQQLEKLGDVVLWGGVLVIVVMVLWPRSSGPEAGGVAASFDLPVVGSTGRFTHAGQRDRPLLIEVFASWCTACRRSSGNLEALAEAADSGRLDVVAVSVDDTEQAALSAKRSWPIPVPVLFDEAGSFQRKYDVRVLPTFILIDRQGKVVEVQSGPPGPSDLRRWLRTGS